jgi:hypothetical protein
MLEHVNQDGKREVEHKDLHDRQVSCVSWKIGGQIYCVPEDMTAEEQDQLARIFRTQMGPEFAMCPLDYIKDRMVGGGGGRGARVPAQDAQRLGAVVPQPGAGAGSGAGEGEEERVMGVGVTIVVVVVLLLVVFAAGWKTGKNGPW